MTLAEFLEHNRISAAEFGRRIGVGSRMTVARYVRHERIPRPAVMRRIVEVTNGQVQPGDFYPVAALTEPEAGNAEPQAAA